VHVSGDTSVASQHSTEPLGVAPQMTTSKRVRLWCGQAIVAAPLVLRHVGAPSEQASSRASERVVAELVDIADRERHAQAAAERQLHGLRRERHGWLGWYGGEPRPRMRPDSDRTSTRASSGIAGSIILSRK